MIRPVFISFSVATAIFLTACESDQQPKAHPKDHHQFGYTGDTQTQVGPGPDTGTTAPSSGNETSPDNGGAIAPPPPPPPSSTPDQKKPDSTVGANGPAGAPKKDYPYATPVAGKPGFVTSPFAPYSGYVDVRGFPPGTEVKDPYTQKVFLVP
jgi:hypothetical protein